MIFIDKYHALNNTYKIRRYTKHTRESLGRAIKKRTFHEILFCSDVNSF